ncbi:putative ferric-chelate reductase 1 homolog [Copidosoma floridanum]|uniref:putative ferric-chelate reductase 1 homolog n=1 Tax=Copidosoma floridanum TaxID=29053 RepID=UPI0006C952F6|nr:putative ferric-chelate reductase 1 homolog [Copidosoma floridanum]
MKPKVSLALGCSWLLLALTARPSQGSPSGAPLSTCDTMTPLHKDKLPQESNAPYQLLPSRGQGRIRLILGSPEGYGYEGFIVLARDIATGELVGEFSNLPDDSARHLECTTGLKDNDVNDLFYEGCGSVKNCFGTPDLCVDQKNCMAAVSVLVQGERYVFEMQSRNSKYVAVGLSEDNKMGDDAVAECVNEDERVVLHTSWNKGKHNTRLSKNETSAAVELVSSSFQDGVISCKFLRNKLTTVQGQRFDLVAKPYHLLIAIGSSLKPNSVGYHDLAMASSAEPRLLSDVGTLKSASELLTRLHGALMIVSWLGTASVGMLLARYYRQTWLASQLCGKDHWFAWHRVFMFLTWAMSITAAVLIFVEVGGLSTEVYHRSFGIATNILCFVQPFMAVMRPHPGAPRRALFNWVHWLVGNAAHVCAIIAIFFAVRLTKAKLPDWVDWVLVGYVAFHVLTHLFLTFAGCASDRQGSQRVNSFPMKDVHSRNSMSHVDARRDAPGSALRKLVFGIYFLVMAAVATALVLIVVFAPIGDSWRDLVNLVKNN